MKNFSFQKEIKFYCVARFNVEVNAKDEAEAIKMAADRMEEVNINNPDMVSVDLASGNDYTRTTLVKIVEDKVDKSKEKYAIVTTNKKTGITTMDTSDSLNDAKIALNHAILTIREGKNDNCTICPNEYYEDADTSMFLVCISPKETK